MDGIRLLFKEQANFQVINRSVSGKQFFRTIGKNIPDVVCIVNIRDTYETIEQLKRKYPGSGIILPEHSDERIIRYRKITALLHSCVKKDRNYIDGYVSNTFIALGNFLNEEALKPMIQAALQSRVRNSVLARPVLTLREQQVVSLETIGNTIKEIAAILNLMESSIVTMRKRILKKIGGRTKSDLIMYGLKNKLDRKFDYSPPKSLKK